MVTFENIFYFAFYWFLEVQGIGTVPLKQNSNFSSAVLYFRHGSVLEASKHVIQYEEEHEQVLGFLTCFSYIWKYKKSTWLFK